MAAGGNIEITKSQLIENITNKLDNCSKIDIKISVDKVLDYVIDCLGKNKKIEIRGFGSFCSRYRKERKAHNPRTGEKVIAKAKYVPCFKAGKELRNRVNKSPLY